MRCMFWKRQHEILWVARKQYSNSQSHVSINAKRSISICFVCYNLQQLKNILRPILYINPEKHGSMFFMFHINKETHSNVSWKKYSNGWAMLLYKARKVWSRKAESYVLCFLCYIKQRNAYSCSVNQIF